MINFTDLINEIKEQYKSIIAIAFKDYTQDEIDNILNDLLTESYVLLKILLQHIIDFEKLSRNDIELIEMILKYDLLGQLHKRAKKMDLAEEYFKFSFQLIKTIEEKYNTKFLDIRDIR
jgi:hypothetical protein